MDNGMVELRGMMLELVKQNLALGQRIDATNASLGQQNIALGQRIDATNAALGQRIDETNKRMDQKMDLMVQNMTLWRQEIKEEQGQLVKMFSEIMQKFDGLSDAVKEKIGFVTPPESAPRK